MDTSSSNDPQPTLEALQEHGQLLKRADLAALPEVAGFIESRTKETDDIIMFVRPIKRDDLLAWRVRQTKRHRDEGLRLLIEYKTPKVFVMLWARPCLN